MMQTIIKMLVMIMMFVPHAVSYAYGGTSIVAEHEFSYDTDSVEISLDYLGVKTSLAKSSNITMSIGNHQYRDSDGKESFAGCKLEYEGQLTRNTKTVLKGTQLQSDSWSPFLFNGLLTSRPSEKLYLEVFAERSLVDSTAAIRSGYMVDTYGFSVDYSVLKDITLVGALYQQDFSDSNKRIGKVANIVYSPRQLDWLSLQFRSRFIESEFNGDGYFSPLKAEKYFFIVGLARAFYNDKFAVRIKGGPGRVIYDGEHKNDWCWEAEIKGWFTDNFGVKFNYGFFDSCSTVDRSAYGYSYGTIIFTFAY